MPQSGPTLERLLVPLLYRSQSHRLARRLNRRKVVIGTYHGFTTERTHAGIENHERKHLDVERFVEQMTFLEANYRVLPLEDVTRALTTGASLPDRTAVITIDDGYRSIRTVAFPVLLRLGLPASVFLATEFVDGRRFLWTDRVEYAVNRTRRDVLELAAGSIPLRLPISDRESRMAADRKLRSTLKSQPQADRDRSVESLERAAGFRLDEADGDAALYQPLEWTEIAEMAASGLVTFGSHTHTHVILSRCDPSHAEHELAQSKAIIERRLGLPCRTFCYPNGRRGDFNGVTRRLLQQSGFTSGLTTVYGMNDRDADVFELKRYNLGKPMMTGEIDVRLAGLMDLGSALKRGVRPAG